MRTIAFLTFPLVLTSWAYGGPPSTQGFQLLEKLPKCKIQR